MRGSKPKDISGMTFGRLTAVSIAGRQANRVQWLCKCSCGKEIVAISTNLIRGNTRSCGCLNHETKVLLNTKHGMSKTAIHSLWEKMLARCHSITNAAYPRYGGRGITVCERWHDFSNFYRDMGDRPKGKSLDRINNDGEYSPENCRWATDIEQARNKRDSHLITYKGRTQCLSAWSEETGIKPATLRWRIAIAGMPVEEAFRKPIRGQKPALELFQ